MTTDMKKKLDEIEEVAKAIFEMVDRVKGNFPKVKAPEAGLTAEEQVAQEQAQRDADRIKQTFSDGPPTPDEVFEVNEDEPINLADIPF